MKEPDLMLHLRGGDGRNRSVDVGEGKPGNEHLRARRAGGD
jgi:hypothetical protein